MAPPDIHPQTIPITTLPTTLVKVFPTLAQITRHLPSLTIRPGRNKITLTNLTACADESSIKVEALFGAAHEGENAVISDISVDFLPFASLWSEEQEESEGSESEGYDGPDEIGDDEGFAELAGGEAVEFLKGLRAVQAEQKGLEDRLEGLEARLKVVREFGEGVVAGKEGGTVVLKEWLGIQEEGWEKVSEEVRVVRERLREVERMLMVKEREKRAVLAPGRRKWKVLADKARRKALARRQARKDRLEEKGPKLGAAYRVNIWIEGAAEEDVEIGLKLTYLVRNASWEPRYDASLDTSVEKPVLQLAYHAHVKNMTGESWENCQITLSTSQATFRGLADHAPTLEPWTIRLAQNHELRNLTTSGKEKAILFSKQENIQRTVQKAQQPAVMSMDYSGQQQPMKPMAQRFDFDSSIQQPQMQDYQMQLMELERQNKIRLLRARSEQDSEAREEMSMSMQPMMAAAGPPLAQAGQMSSRPMRKSAAPRSSPNPFALKATSAIRRSFAAGSSAEGPTTAEDPPSDSDSDSSSASSSDSDSSSLPAKLTSPARLRFSTPSQSSTGLTTTFTLPSPLTIPSSPLPRRHLLADLTLPKTRLQHISIPKLRPATFLKAHLINTTSTPLLRGSCGLTLDGSFLGSLPIPAAAPGEKFSIQLGVDASVHVEYKKPTRLKLREKGVWIKEAGVVYSRSITVSNARKTPVNLLVIDQVPRSEDEKVVVSVLNPRGLEFGGGPVLTGVGIDPAEKEAGSQSAAAAKRSSMIGRVPSISKLGKVDEEDANNLKVEGGYRVKAELKKDGEVRWNVELGGGKGVGLALDWEVRYPSESGVVTAVGGA